MGVYQGWTFADPFGVEPWELLCEYEGEVDDESLLDRLSALAAMLDPVPDSAAVRARAVFKQNHRGSQPTQSRQAQVRGDG